MPLWKERSPMRNLSSEKKPIKTLAKIKLSLKPKTRLPRLKLRPRLRRRLPRVRCLRKKRNLPKPRRLPPMPLLKPMRDSLQNLPQLSTKEDHGTSEFEMNMSSRK